MATDSDEGRDVPLASSRPRRSRKSDERDVGTALRSAYQRTVDETIPADLLDLLGKLN
jgi:Anti-sigma factor NepR